MLNMLTQIIFLMGMTIVVFLSITGRIHLGLLFLIPLFPLQNVMERFHQFPFGKDFNDILLIAMVLGWLFKSLSKGERKFEITPFNKILFIMLIYTYFSLWKGSFYLGLPAPLSASDIRVQTWKNYMIFPLLFFITANNIKNLKQIKWLVGAMVLSMFIMDYYTGNQIKWMPGLISRTKIHGTFVWLGPNEVASFYAAYSFVILGILFFDTNKIRRLFFSITICLNMYCMLFLYSRGAYLGTFVGAVLISFIKNKKFLILLIMVAMFWQVILPSTVIDRINETKTEEGTFDNSIENRLTMWEQSIKLFNENPIFGVGFNVIPFLGLRLGDTHNVYVKILTEQGLVGVIIFVCFLILAIKEGWKLYGKADDNFLKGLGLGFVACSLSLIITNFFGDRWTYLQVGTYFWVFLGLVVRGNLITQEEKVLTNSSQTTKRL